MTKRIFSLALFVCIGLSVFPSILHSQNADITNGLNWLNGSQNQDGSWNSLTTSTSGYYATTAVLDSFQFLNETSQQYMNGLAWLQNQSFDTMSTTYLAPKITILASTGQSTSSNVDTLLSYRNSDSGWGGYIKYPSTIFHTAIALQALHAANYSDTTLIGQSLNYLTSNQNADGGWSFITGQESNVFTTSTALKAHAVYNGIFINQGPIDKAVAYLLSKQNSDGGFGSSPSKVFETGLAFDALVASGANISVIAPSAINYLTSTQLADGSWDDDPYSTALALRALASARANLVIASADITLSKSMPRENETVAITAKVHNTGFDAASGIVVRFFLGDPAAGGMQIGVDQIIPSLVVGGSAQASITASFTGTGGKTIFVKVDPDNIISETNETDNASSSRIWVATAPDIAIFSEDLKPSTYVPASGTAFTLAYTVRNLGESSTDGFDIALYDGNPSSGGSLLQTAHISGLNGTEVRTGSIGVTLTGDGSHILYLTADLGQLIPELSETNNTGTVTIQVGGVQQYADLVAGSIILNPSRPHAGESVQISASVRNEGIEDASSFTVEIFDGAPESGGTLIYSKIISATKGTEEIITTNWTITSGIHDIYVILDRNNGIVETNETNNTASLKVMTDMVDITVSATDLSSNPVHPVSGDTVVLSITVHNQGIRETGAFNLALYDGDPNAGGALLQTFTISNITGDGSTTLPYTFTAIPWTYRFYAIADTENTVTELYEDNNQAIRSLKIKAPGEILGPDLVPEKIDHSETTTDSHTLVISGNIHASFREKNNDNNTATFNVMVFEDKDNDHLYTPEADKKLYEGKYAIGNIDKEQPPVIAIVVHDSAHPSNLGERVYLLAHDGKIAWGPVYLNELDPETPFASYDSVPIITDLDGDGQAEIKIKGNSKEFVIDMDGYLKQKREID